MNIKLSPFAEQDLDESKEYYDQQKIGLGDEFISEIVEKFELIKQNPKQFPIQYKKMQKATLDRFSFGIFYIVKNLTIYVLGIFHSSSNPKTMKDRYKTQG